MLRFEVVIDPSLGPEVEGSVAFGEFVPKDDGSAVYPQGALVSFYLDLLQGRPFPLRFVTRGIESVGQLVAITLFLRRELAIHPGMPGFVAEACLVDQLGLVGLAHVNSSLGRFFKLLAGYLPPGLSQKEQQIRIVTAVGWVYEYVIEGNLPALPPQLEPPRIFDTGSNGFVLAEVDSGISLEDGWVELYRVGYLRGAVFSTPRQDRRHVLAARKSPFLAFDLRKAAEVLNEAETAMGEPPGWSAGLLWLYGPVDGTFLPVPAVTQVLVRV